MDTVDHKTFVCYECGVRQPIKDTSILVKIQGEDESMGFCSWKCLATYATDVVTP